MSGAYSAMHAWWNEPWVEEEEDIAEMRQEKATKCIEKQER